ncbi:hypothetical protein THIOM_000323 [Candidatus Thiomargarita nelsonii]|uniref:Uncharacterized protein n=1 Tax=Candidatus Thiomargarita nelsonii TaxID=1003181 RepID=A0A0A6NZV5_9GAMM|nr:hypothetical protein THIOM_000323 [Candidatus Thiomargarita nelsonii]
MASDNNQEWTQDDCVNLESAREILNGLIGFRVKWIRTEKEKIPPNKTSLAKWEKEKAALIEERKRLNVLEQDNVSKIRCVYGAMLKRLMAYGN